MLEHSLWALANIVSDAPEFAAAVEKEDIFDLLMSLSEESLPDSAKETALDLVIELMEFLSDSSGYLTCVLVLVGNFKGESQACR